VKVFVGGVPVGRSPVGGRAVREGVFVGVAVGVSVEVFVTV
jgi:hypothetical protein